MTNKHPNDHPDKKTIERLGGVLALSNYLDLSYQCVFNWTKRGIPAQVKIDNAEIFLTKNPSKLPETKPEPEEA